MRILERFGRFYKLWALVALFTACQQEEPFESDIDPEHTLTVDASVVDMLKRTVIFDGSYDNIVDGSSCLAIQFPYSVKVGETELLVETMADFQEIEDILDATLDILGVSMPLPTMEIIFPVTITLQDFTQVVIENEEALLEYVNACPDNGVDEDIECLDLQYPIDFFTFDTNLERTGSFTVEHDEELSRFLAGLGEAELISVDYPITIVKHDSTELVINTNEELTKAMQDALDACDEDDDNDHQDDDFTANSLEFTLMGCPWKMSLYQASETEVEETYQDFLLTFSEDGKVFADNGYGQMEEGEWSISFFEYQVFLNLMFEDAELLNGTRYSYRIGEEVIKSDGEAGGTLILERACGYETDGCNPNFITSALESGCRWSITDEAGEFSEPLGLDFSNGNITAYRAENDVEDGESIYAGDNISDEGRWMVANTVVTFNDLDRSLADYVGEWEVIECSEKRFRLRRGEEIIVLVEHCPEEFEDDE